MNQEDHDILIEIRQDQKNFIENFRKHVITFDKHVVDDNFTAERLKKDISWIQKIIYGCVGAVGLMELAIKIIPLIK